jgi:internalin A
MSALALKLIQEAKEQRLTRLDLGNCGLTELPDELFELIWLEELILSDSWNEYSFEKKMSEYFRSQNKDKTNNIKSISPKIKILRGLKKLIACGNYAKWLRKHLNPVETVLFFHVSETQLQKLYVSLTEVSDLTPLKDLIQLQQLDVSLTEVSDLTSLKDLTQLQQLYVNSTQVSDLKPLKDLTQLQKLYVSYTQVSDLTPLKGLTQLQQLYVHETQVSDLTPLKNLTQLQQLYVQKTQVSDLTPLKGLTQLQQLYVQKNQVSDLTPLKALTQLQQLYVSETLVSDLIPLKALTQLQQLDISETQVSDLTPLKGLMQLQQLYVYSNQVSDLTPLKDLMQLQQLYVYSNQVSDLMPLKALTQLKQLCVQDCSIQYIPKEIYDQLDCAEDLFAYWQDLDQSQTQINQQLKIMFLGNGCVGKTTLLHWFLDNKFKDLSHEDARTHGIFIKPYKFPNSETLAHFWDFGGQEVYHATHRLFLGRRSVYLLVWASETPEKEQEERHPPQYWLDMIADIADTHERSRVLIIQNLFEGQTERNILTDEARKAYEAKGLDITTYCVNAKTGLKIKSLKTAIEEEAEHLLKTHVEELPESWVNIRTAVAERRFNKEKTLAWADFKTICQDCKLTTDPSVVLGYLHRAGELFYYQNQFDNQIILDQEWALKAVYAILKRHRIERYNGIFTLADLMEIWHADNPNLTNEEAQIFLNFMLANKTAFYTEGSRERGDNPEFVVPQLLPLDKPKMYSTWQKITDKTQHRIQYTFLHRDIIERFIIETAHLSNDKAYWRNGLFIDDGNNQAVVEVIEAQSNKYIQIECTGSNQTQFLQTIREEFNKIRTLDKATEYRFTNGSWQQITGERIIRIEDGQGFKQKPPPFDTNILTSEKNMKQHLLNLIADGKLKEALDLMRQIENPQNSYFKDPLIGMLSRYNRNQNDKDEGTISTEDYRIERNRIEAAAKNLLNGEFDESKAPAPPKASAHAENVKNTEGGASKSTDKPKVYFSYAWDGSNDTGESREKIVQELYNELKTEGYDVRRDKEDVGYKDSIEDFMKEIGRGSFIVVTISDKYLKSPNCMFELLQIYRKSNSDFTEFKDKIYPIVLGDAKIYDPMDVLDYAVYWQEKKDSLEAKIKVVGLSAASGIIADFDKFNEITNNISLISRMISSINTLKPTMLSADNFAVIKEAIVGKVVG